MLLLNFSKISRAVKCCVLLALLSLMLFANAGPGPRVELHKNKVLNAHSKATATPKTIRATNSDESGDYGDFWKWYTDRRRDQKGNLDWSTYEKELQHRAIMPRGHFGSRNYSSNTPPPPLPEGSWEYIGPTNFTGPTFAGGRGPISGRVSNVAYDPTNQSTIYAAAGHGGLWKSTDSGVTWSCLSNSWPRQECTSVVVDPVSSNTIYVGTGDYYGSTSTSDVTGSGYGIGLMKSQDGGATWDSSEDKSVELSSKSAFGQSCVSKILVCPESHLNLIATTGRGQSGSGYVFTSSDGGKSWITLLTLGKNNWSDATMGLYDGTHGRQFFVAASYPTQKIYVSSDKGGSWSSIGSPLVAYTDVDSNVAMAATDYGTVYVMYALSTANSVSKANQNFIFKSTNAKPNYSTPSWTNITGNLRATSNNKNSFWSQGFYDFCIGAFKAPRSDGTSTDCLVVGNIDVEASPNLDGKWSTLASVYDIVNKVPQTLIHADQHGFAFNSNGQDILVANDGGVSRIHLDLKGNNSLTYQLNAGLGLAQIYALDVHPTMDWRVLAGLQDDGVAATQFDSNSDATFSQWTSTPNGGDGGSVAYFYPNPAIFYTDNANVSLVYETRNGGQTFTDISKVTGTDSKGNVIRWFGEKSSFVPPMVVDSASAFLYFGTVTLWQYSIQNQTWKELPIRLAQGANEFISCIAVSPTDSNFIYVGTNEGNIFMSIDQGTTFRYINGDLPWATKQNCSGLSVSPINKYELIATTSGLGTRNVWQSQNTNGTHWRDCNGSHGGATDILLTPVNSIVRDFDTPGTTWYVGTDLGVMMTADGGNTWSNLTAMGLPNVQVNAMVANANSRDLYAGTFGRGVWRLHDKSIGIQVNFSVDPVAQGNPTVCTITTANPAPIGGYDVGLDSDDPASTPLPAGNTIHIAAGSSSANFTINVPPSATLHTVVITGNIGASNGAGLLTIQQPVMGSSTLSSYSVFGGSDFPTWTITLNHAAPHGGLIVGASSSNPSAVKLPSPNFNVSEGYNSSSMVLITKPVSVITNVTLTASVAGQSTAVVLEVKPIWVTSLVLGSLQTFGGSDNTGATININYAAPQTVGTNVAIVSSNPTVASVDQVSPVTVTPGYASAAINITTHVVSVDTTVVFSASDNGSTKTASLLVKRNFPTTMTVANAAPYGGTDSDTGTVNLKYSAATDKSAGATLALKSSNAAALTVPATTPVTPGYASSNFNVVPKAVKADTAVTITATLNGVSVSASVTVKAIVVSTLTINPISGFGGVDNPSGTVSLNYAANAGTGETVALSSSNTAAASVPSSIPVSPGYDSTTFAINSKVVSKDTAVTISASLNGVSKTASYTVKAILISALTLSQPSAFGGTDNPSGTVNINSAAPAAGTTVALSSSIPAAASVTSSTPISPGYAVANFPITTHVVAADLNVVITASLNSSARTAILLVKANRPVSLTISPTSAWGGTDSPTGTITLMTAAAPAGQVATLSSSDPSAAKVASSATINPGYTTGTFAVTTFNVATSARTVRIMATCNGGTVTQTLTVNPNGARTLTLDATKVIGGQQNPNGTVTLYAAAPGITGIKISLGTSDTTVATVPAGLTVNPGYTSSTFPITTKYVNSVRTITITAVANGVSKSTLLTVDTVQMSGLTLNPNRIIGSKGSAANFTFASPTGTPGVIVYVFDNGAGVISHQASISVGPNLSGGSVAIATQPVTALKLVTITVTAGTSKASAVLSIYPTSIIGFQLTNPVVGGNNFTGLVTLNGKAPAGGIVVSLKSNNSAVAAVPGTATAVANSPSAPFPVTTTGVTAATTVTLTGIANGVTKTATLNVLPATLASITTTTPSIKGGAAAPLSVNLTGFAGAGGQVVMLRSSNPVVLPVPASTAISAQHSFAPVSAKSNTVAASTPVTITASQGTVVKTVVVTVNP